jgi:FKBP-type peptidyl-prolyl cis-trans isomerase
MGTKIGYKYAIQFQKVNYNDDKCYCWNHKKIVINKYKQEIKEKAKEEKEEAKKAKAVEKLKAKEEKQKAKETKQKANKKPKFETENVVLGPSIITDMSGNEINLGCIQILKSGPNKGKPCGCKIYSENLCKRHFLMKHEELIIYN